MNVDFPFFLLCATVVTGIIWLLEVVWLRARRKRQLLTSEMSYEPKLVEYARSFFPVLLIVFLLRSFIVQPFRVPTGSLEPTIRPGDFVIVNMFAYGLRLPVWHKVLWDGSTPKRGDIVVFRYPVNSHLDLIKRVIGLPGDHISYIDKVLYINGVEMKQTKLGASIDSDGGDSPRWPVEIKQEDLFGVKHKIYICPKTATACPGAKAENFYNVVVPKGEYFMMGDNRDNSDDSRFWGFVPANDLIGKAEYVAFSWDSELHEVRWHRIGDKL